MPFYAVLNVKEEKFGTFKFRGKCSGVSSDSGCGLKRIWREVCMYGERNTSVACPDSIACPDSVVALNQYSSFNKMFVFFANCWAFVRKNTSAG